jgi:hypothetical protein
MPTDAEVEDAALSAPPEPPLMRAMHNLSTGATAIVPNVEPSDEPTLPFTIYLPVSVAAVLKVRTDGVLDVAETAALIAQLYANAPLERGAVVLSREAHGRICEALGQSPQTVDALIEAIDATVTFSIAGVKMKWNAQEVEILMARNANDLPPKEWAAEVFESMKRAWIDGRI